jgi:hypothetical protein
MNPLPPAVRLHSPEPKGDFNYMLLPVKVKVERGIGLKKLSSAD